jgi:hypothetical protein
MDFTDAIVVKASDATEASNAIEITRNSLIDAVGEAATVRAAAVAANFQMMNIVVDGAGVPIGRDLAEWADTLGVAAP